jgi:hypothetical protein
VAVIGSSDSAYIDSLYSRFDSWRRKYGARGKRIGTLPKEPELPWSYFKDRQLPEELAALTNGLKPGECRAPFRSRTGHFLVRLIRVFPIREIPFQEAFLHVVYLATRDRFLEMDSVVETRARKYYAANPSQFALPDTLDMRTWLIPGPESRPAVTKAGHGKPSVLPDTSRFKPMGISSLALPDDLRFKLMARLNQDTARAFFGPVPDRFGCWYFQVRSRKRVSGVIPYRLARKEILSRIVAPLEDEGSGTASEEANNEVGGYLALARAFRLGNFRKQMEERNGTGAPMRNMEGPPPSGPSGSEAAGSPEEMAKRLRSDEDKRRADEARMLSEARVDLNRLFRN